MTEEKSIHDSTKGQRSKSHASLKKTTPQKIPKIFQDIFQSIDKDGDRKIRAMDFLTNMKKMGILSTDPRIKSIFHHLSESDFYERTLDIDDFYQLIQQSAVLVKKTFTGSLVVPEFSKLCDEFKTIYDEVKEIKAGKVASYIPQLKSIPAENFGVSICTIDGQRWSQGDAGKYFSLQSTCKPLNYCLALEEFTENKVHQYVGREPSGHSFNEITLDTKKRPHNPMINAGAIMMASLVKPKYTPAKRFEYIMNSWRNLCGGQDPQFNNSVYLSERTTADRNFALGYFMRENNCFPEGTSLEDTLDFYFQCCSVELTCNALSVAAATLASAGICPLTNKKIFRPDTVKNCLSLMYSCGMYDYSGEFAFSVGIPAKSGVGGGLMVVVPNLMGIAIWSPLLDKNGNSVKGIEFCQRLVKKFNFHNYDSLISGKSHKINPRQSHFIQSENPVTQFIWAASQGDVHALQQMVAQGVDINEGDYDGRTALHLAASEGHLETIKFLISHGASPNPQDRWGRTPLENAQKSKFPQCAEYIDQFIFRK